mmetsp:Transcript_89627/g.187207  ORF Transcript_89627/g.187207 Transcript_89627/m.187207 type:complete len:244 (-) Transcript_89627:183-914(-)
MIFRCCCGPSEISEGVEEFPSATDELYTGGNYKVYEAPSSPPKASNPEKPTLLARTSPSASPSSSMGGSTGLAEKVNSGGRPSEVPRLPLTTANETRPRANRGISGSEKAHKAFRDSCIEGRACTILVDEDLGEAKPALRQEGQYRVSLKERALIMDPGAGKATVKCPIDGIEDIYQLADGEESFPPSILKALKPGEMDRLLLVVFYSASASTGGEPEMICFLERSSQGRDELLDFLKNLCLG